MDVNGMTQNLNNINSYGTSENVSQYSNQAVEIKQVEEIPENKKENLDKNPSQKKEVSKEELDKALNKINNFLKDEKTHAEYSVHKDFGTIMIKIVDENTKEVLLEVPPKKILDIVASMCRQVGLFDRKA